MAQTCSLKRYPGLFFCLYNKQVSVGIHMNVVEIVQKLLSKTKTRNMCYVYCPSTHSTCPD